MILWYRPLLTSPLTIPSDLKDRGDLVNQQPNKVWHKQGRWTGSHYEIIYVSCTAAEREVAVKQFTYHERQLKELYYCWAI